MAVSGKTAAPHEIPYYLGTDNPPDMAAVTKAIAERTHGQLDAIAPKQITGVAKKQLLIANSSGVVTAVTASGDVTNDESGVFTIADGVVGSRKTKLTEGVVGAEDLTLGTQKDVPGTSKAITLAVKSTVFVTAVFKFEVGTAPAQARLCTGYLRVDGENRAGSVQETLLLKGEVRTAVGLYSVTLEPGEHTLLLRAERAEADGVLNLTGAGTKYSYRAMAA
jgi:hypothetical protein